MQTQRPLLSEIPAQRPRVEVVGETAGQNEDGVTFLGEGNENVNANELRFSLFGGEV